MDDLAATNSTPEGMGDNGTRGQNGIHKRGTRREWMEYCTKRQKGIGIDPMDAMMTQLKCSKQGRLDDATTQNRPSGDHKNMSTRWLLTKKIDTNMDKYEGKVVPQVQVLQVKKFNFEEW